jgi:ankyrin repeat protein
MNSNPLVKQVVEQTGLHPERAELAVELVARYMVEKLRYPYSRLPELLLNTDDPYELIEHLYAAIKQPFHEIDVQVVEHILDAGIPVDLTNSNKETLLHFAAFWGRFEIAKLLIDRQADVNVRDDQGRTPVHIAACSNASLRVARLLLDAGAKADLFTACMFGDLARVTLLIYENPEVVHRREWFCKDTPLHKAAQKGHREVVVVLLENGADLMARNRLGQTALHQAALGGHPETVEYLIVEGAELNTRDSGGCTPLDLAVLQRGVRSPVVKVLRDHDAKRGIGVRGIRYDTLVDVLAQRLGCEIELKMSEDGDHIETFNVHPKDELYFIKKVNQYSEVGQQDEALEIIKAALFPDEEVSLKSIFQVQDGVVDMLVEFKEVQDF